jgi:transcription elongation GreA/GreB family factor
VNIARKKKVLNLIDSEIEKAKTTSGRALSSTVKTGSILVKGKEDLAGADLAKSYLEKLKALKNEIKSLSNEKNLKINLGSFALVRYEDGSLLEICIVKNPVSVPNFLFVSKDSPLGSLLLGKKEGESFSYNNTEDETDKNFSGVVIRVD